MLVNESTYFFYIVQKIMGLAPYMLSNGQYFIAQYMNAYTFIYMGMMGTYILLGLKKYVRVPGVQFGTYVTLSGATVTLLHVMLRQSSAVKAHNEMISVSEDLKKYYQISYRKIFIYRVIEFIVSLGLVIGISVYLIQSSTKSEWYSCASVVFALLIRVMMVNQFVWLVHALKINLVHVNKMLDNEQMYMSEGLTEIAHLHERLTAIGEQTNDAFSVALLCWALESFAKICYTSYHLAVCVLYPAFPTCGPEKYESCYTFIWYLLQLSYTVAICQKTSGIAQDTSIRIHQLLRTIDSPENIVERLEMFSYQLVPKFNFQASGFFVMDYTFLTTLLGLVTTYVIIFVQFFVIDNSNSNLANVKNVHQIISTLQ